MGRVLICKMNSALVHVVFEETVIHTQLETFSVRLNKVSLELGRTGNKDLGLEAVVAKVIRKEKAWIF